VSIFAIILLVLLGIVLLLLEFLVVPGVTVAGIGGMVALIVAVVLSYSTHGASVGNYVVLGTLFTMMLVLYIAFKTGTWKKVMLNNSVISRVEYGLSEDIVKVGDTGETITRLNPIGKVMINEQVYEGKSVGGFINEHTKVEVIKVQRNNIIVKQLN